MQSTKTPAPTSRLVAKVLRQLLAGERFETLADLTDALKFRCARLHIRPTVDDVTAAYRLVGSNAPLSSGTFPDARPFRTGHGCWPVREAGRSKVVNRCS